MQGVAEVVALAGQSDGVEGVVEDGGTERRHVQAQLVLAYLEGAQVAGDASQLEVAEDTLRYVMREMTDPAGGFYSAEDADSIPPELAGSPDAHKMEGAFYLWTAEEVDTLLGDESPLVKKR